MNKEQSSVKASELIAKLEEGGIRARVVDEGELRPFLSRVDVTVDPETHLCTLFGWYRYDEDCATHGVDPGQSEAEVLGVTFANSILYAENNDIEIADGDIDYDEGLSEGDVLNAAKKGIRFVRYNPDNFPFQEELVTDEDIEDCLEWSIGADDVIAKDKDGNVYQYSSRTEVPKGFRVLAAKSAIKVLAHKRPGIEYGEAY